MADQAVLVFVLDYVKKSKPSNLMAVTQSPCDGHVGVEETMIPNPRHVKWLILLMNLVKTWDMDSIELHLPHIRDSDVVFLNPLSSITIHIPVEFLKVKRKDEAQVLHKETPTLHEWKLECWHPRPESICNHADSTLLSPHPCDQCGDVEELSPACPQHAKPMNLFKDLSRLAEKSPMATYLPLYKQTHINPTDSSLSGYVELPPLVAVIVCEVFEDPGVILEKEEQLRRGICAESESPDAHNI
ncbi:hypothetical protein BS47DRAFT_1399088 [Hydnum rufescens UP504]|uniref:Uncharacterized protein n=1 Tax=Hydnum rufescens UP504 TaxID=1448309 RepID=A0A9P6AJK5_9AGAM|nr:hypothetical protein BS47DRAFT_1399088 [Hydnum rufescens UP504]